MKPRLARGRLIWIKTIARERQVAWREHNHPQKARALRTLRGGTLAHGIVGLFIGPIILSLAWELMVAWIRTDRAKAQSLPG
jgi:hypothetical protein